MSYLGQIFGGSSPVLNADINQAGALSGFATGVGEGDATAASTFYRDILSGDPTKEAEALAPEISAARGQAAQQKKTRSEFGTRSGGNAAANAATDAGVTSDILNLEGGLKSSAASGAAQLGTAEQGIGLSANQLQSQEEQQRIENWRNSVLGQAIYGGEDLALAYAGKKV